MWSRCGSQTSQEYFFFSPATSRFKLKKGIQKVCIITSFLQNVVSDYYITPRQLTTCLFFLHFDIKSLFLCLKKKKDSSSTLLPIFVCKGKLSVPWAPINRNSKVCVHVYPNWTLPSTRFDVNLAPLRKAGRLIPFVGCREAEGVDVSGV